MEVCSKLVCTARTQGFRFGRKKEKGVPVGNHDGSLYMQTVAAQGCSDLAEQ